ncbi:hypothetical protein SUGI_1146480 [Cryptomeria japonica]|uniref:protein DJ-1 homolog D n=1 Tax=Cryptomeria japonica TaxID=3369 RepID=UPI002414C32C|nr:protein DJ-1 homolog D [Cryptomeria japonica]GLJ53729.1 hypothetical protein SUGI_1146480 [Cryptomeria japonica]
MDSAAQKHVLMICGDYMEDYEVMVPFQTLQAYGIKVDAVCPGKKAGDKCPTAILQSFGHQTYSELRGHNFELTATFDYIDVKMYDGLVIPGGRAPEYLALNESVLELVKHFFDSNKPIAAICHGQLILAAAGVLKEKMCTAYPAVKPVVVAAGGVWKEPEALSACCIDGNLITSAAWHGHPKYISLFLKSLGGKVTGTGKRVLFLCGDYMEDYEIIVPFQALQSLGCNVDAVCPGKNVGDTCLTAIHDFEGDQTYSEKPGHKFTLNANFEDVKVEDFDALVIPGGRAPEYLALNNKVLSIVKLFAESKKPIASICHGQQILAAANILKGKRCTAYPAVKLNVLLAGAEWMEPEPITKCFTDENLVTAAAWPAHPEFISHIMVLLGISVSF